MKFSGQVIVSLDWHQVLDIKRHSRGTDRPSPPYTLLPEYERLIRGLKDRGVAVLVCSYTCSPVYRDQVQSLSWKYPDLFGHIDHHYHREAWSCRWETVSTSDNHAFRLLPLGAFRRFRRGVRRAGTLSGVSWLAGWTSGWDHRCRDQGASQATVPRTSIFQESW